MKRVVVTGLGCVTSLGMGVDVFWSALLQGTTGMQPLNGLARGDVGFSHAAQVLAFAPEGYLSAEMLKLSERSSQFALVAAREAVRQADWTSTPSEAATILGCATGGRTLEEPETAALYRDGKRVHPLTVPRSMGSSGTALVAMQHGLCGPAFTLNTACASGAHAIGLAFQSIRSGAVEVAVTGGHEAPLTYGFLKAWDSLRVVSNSWCKPFAADRNGMSLGEGAAVLVLESYEHAERRGATVLGEIVGFGMSCDASHMTQPKSSGAVRAMEAALRDAGLIASQIGYINAHGTGTKINDASEANAIRDLFGVHAGSLPVSSTKASHGHAIAASGAMEAVATILALRDGVAPPTADVDAPDSSLDIDLVCDRPRAIRGDFALSNSFAFGGMNAVLAFRSIR